MRRKLAAGNWKMNGTRAQLAELAQLPMDASVDILLCPPATLLHSMAAVAPNGLALGGQDCHAATKGAHTGDIAAEMLADCGATYTLTGHSERRTDHAETDAIVRAKTIAAQDAGLIAVVCIGETLQERENDQTLDVLARQMADSLPDTSSAANTVIAYEPVWAIGTGLVPTTEQIAQAHDFMRETLSARFGENTANGIRLLYGGSVKGSNAAEIFATSNVDGALVGGASLKAADFGPIISALAAS